MRTLRYFWFERVKIVINEALNIVFHSPIIQAVTCARTGGMDFSVHNPSPDGERVETIPPVGEPRNGDSTRNQKRISLVIDYHPGYPDILGILRKYQPLLHCSDVLRIAVPESPNVQFRRPPNLANHLVRTELSKRERAPLPPVGPCNKFRYIRI